MFLAIYLAAGLHKEAGVCHNKLSFVRMLTAIVRFDNPIFLTRVFLENCKDYHSNLCKYYGSS